VKCTADKAVLESVLDEMRARARRCIRSARQQQRSAAPARQHNISNYM